MLQVLHRSLTRCQPPTQSVGAWVARPQDVVREQDQVVHLSLDDSSITICVAASAGVRECRKRKIETSGE